VFSASLDLPGSVPVLRVRIALFVPGVTLFCLPYSLLQALYPVAWCFLRCVGPFSGNAAPIFFTSVGGFDSSSLM